MYPYNKKCSFEGCSCLSSFGFVKDVDSFVKNFKYFCSFHKLPGMVNINNKLCIYRGCNKYPSFGYIGTRKRLYCSEHKLGVMISFCRRPGPDCLNLTCKTKASYNYPGEDKKIYCFKHRLEGMVNVKNKNKPKINHNLYPKN